MKSALLGLVLLTSTVTFAQNSADTSITSTKHMVYAAAGITPGGLALAAEYENNFERTFGLGGMVRFYSKDDNRGLVGTPGLLAIGGFIRPHFTRGPWDFAVAPGFSLFFISGPRGALGTNIPDQTGIGPTLTLSVMYQLKQNFALGAEQFMGYDWSGGTYRGQPFNDVMIKTRFHF